MRSIRYRFLLILFSVLLTLLAACSDDANNSGDKKVVFWTMQLSPILDDYINDAINQFESNNPGVDVVWVDVSWSDMERKILAAVAAGSAPDVVNLNPQFSAKLAEFDALLDPEDFLASETIEQFLPSVWASNRFQGETFAVPWYLSNKIAIYNKALFTKADAEFPETFNQISSVAHTLKKNSNKYAYFPSFDASEPLENLVMMGGGLLSDNNREAILDSPEGIALFTLYRDLFQSGAVPKSVLTEGHQKAVDLFQSGELAMLLTGMQMLKTIELNAPEIFNNVEVRPQPPGASGKVNIAAMNLAVPKSTEHPELAFKFIAFITSPEWQLSLSKKVPILPSTIESFNDPFFNNTENSSDIYAKARRISMEQILTGDVLVPPFKSYTKLRTIFIRNLQQAMVGELTVEDAVDETSNAWNLILSGGKDD